MFLLLFKFTLQYIFGPLHDDCVVKYHSSRNTGLDCWSCKTESAQQCWLHPIAVNVVSGVTTLWLANLPVKVSLAYYLWGLILVTINIRNLKNYLPHFPAGLSTTSVREYQAQEMPWVR